MEDVLRFMVLRPPTEIDAADTIPVDQPTAFLAGLREALGASSPGDAVRAAAAEFAVAGYLDSVAKLRLKDGFRAFAAELEKMAADDEVDGDHIQDAVRKAFDKSPEELIATKNFTDDRYDTSDALLTIKIVPAEHAKPFAQLVAVFRHMFLIVRVAESDDELKTTRVARILRAGLALPPDLFPLPKRTSSAAAPPPSPASPDRERDLQAADVRATMLRSAIHELIALETTAFVTDPPPTIDQGDEPDRIPGSHNWSTGTHEPRELIAFGGHLHAVPPTPPAAALTPEAVQDLSSTVTTLLRESQLDPAATPLPAIVRRLHAMLCEQVRRIAGLRVQRPAAQIVQAGTTRIRIPGLSRGEVTVHPASAATGLRIPRSFGDIAPVGVADLLIVRQQLKRYELVDVAHVENVLAGERKVREHRRSVVTEETVITEIERTSEEERELESTERFEVQHETNEVVKEDASLEAGVKLTGRYGVAVEFESFANGAVSKSRERAAKHASTYASETTNRAASRLSERFREERIRRTVRETEETNTHELNNVENSHHITGIYQWIEKVYEAQVFNYGLRTMYDFTVPEPASLLIHALKAGAAEGSGFDKPPAFLLTAEQIDETNYQALVLLYDVTSGVGPPPYPFATITKTFRFQLESTEAPEFGIHVDGAELTIPDGYEAIFGHVAVSLTGLSTQTHLDFGIGRRTTRFHFDDQKSLWNTSLDLEATSIPVFVKAYNMRSYAAAVEIECRHTPRAYTQWQHDTHAAILQGYLQKLAKYEEQVAANDVASGNVAGQAPAANRNVERDELKRACIALLTRQHFDLFDASRPGSSGLPEFDFDEATDEGRYVRFFEQAFEWENMTYVFYPYFWGRKSEWIERLSYDDADPLFAAFLKAGSCRVVAPVRPGFETALDHFMSTGDTWSGGELPSVTSELYLPIVEEIGDQLGAPGTETPQGEPWDVHVPTTLIYLKNNDGLPEWTKRSAGVWAPLANDAPIAPGRDTAGYPRDGERR
jgi:hypothetical protein